MKVSVIIPTFKRPKSLRALLHSLAQQEFTHSFEVLVVANFHEPKVARIVADLKPLLKEIKYFYTGKKGVNKARNLGVRKAQGEILVFFDDDCYLQNTKHLQTIYRLHQENKDITGIGGPYICPPKSSLLEKAYQFNADYWLKRSQQNANGRQLLGGNMSIKAYALANQMRFNENIVFGGAEAELNARLKVAGHKLMLVNELGLEHRLNMNFFGFVRRAFKQGQGRHREELVGASSINYHETEIEFSKQTLKPWQSTLINFYMALYGFIYRVGFRAERSNNSKPLSFLKIATAFVNELFKSNDFTELQSSGSSTIAYHLLKRPAFGLKPIFHWLRAHVFWRLIWPFIWLKFNMGRIKNFPVFWPIRKLYWMVQFQLRKFKKIAN